MGRLVRSRSVVAAVVSAVVIVGAVALSAAGAATTPDLPSVPADRLISSSLATLADRSLSVSGTVQTHVDLGVPQLPGTLSDPAGPAGLLLSDQTFKVWRSPDGERIAQILPAAERDLVVTATDAWLWDSDRFTASHATLPGVATADRVPSPDQLDTLVSRVLSRLTPYANVSTAAPIEVAGRPAYVVRLTPTSTSTLVDRIDVAIDAQTRLPLRVEVFASKLAAPVVRAGYTAVSFDPIDPSMFRFTPPAGATVRGLHPPAEGVTGSESQLPSDIPHVRWFGAGFDMIAAVSVPNVPRHVTSFFPYRGPIGSADLVDRGDHTWIVAGLVPPQALARIEPELR